MKKRGHVWWINFDPAIGEEIKKIRPAVVLSIDRSNRKLNRYQVVPFTTSKRGVMPGEVAVTIKGKRNLAKSTQFATVSDYRFGDKMGVLAPHHLKAVEEAVAFQLGLKLKSEEE